MNASDNASDADAPSSAHRLVKLRILDKQVQLGCHPDEEEELMEAAAYIDGAMRELRRRNTTSSIEKIAIVAAINTASSLLKSRAHSDDGDATRERVSRLISHLDNVLSDDDDTPSTTGTDTSGDRAGA